MTLNHGTRVQVTVPVNATLHLNMMWVVLVLTHTILKFRYSIIVTTLVSDTNNLCANQSSGLHL